MHQIENLQELVQDYLGPHREFLDYTTENLTAPGDNYGSVILSVEITVRNKTTSNIELVKVVAKTPPNTELAQKIFNTEVTFKNEIEFYRTIWPLLRKFQQENGLEPGNYVADYAGARFNLNDSDRIDEKAVLLLENLVVKNFGVEPREIGFDLATTRLIVGNLAHFHATVIAFRHRNAEDFEKKIRPYLDGKAFCANLKTDKFMMESMLNAIKILGENKETKHLVTRAGRFIKLEDRVIDGPFVAMAHQDLWVNNIMIKKDGGVPVENRFVDFQVCRWQSTADDLIFFLMSSVQNEVITNNLEELIDFYYNELISNLKKFKCDTEQFSRKLFDDELYGARHEQFCHIAIMLYPICVDKSEVRVFKDRKEGEAPESVFVISKRQTEKMIVVAKAFEKMGWFD